jgi:hypothetical protein
MQVQLMVELRLFDGSGYLIIFYSLSVVVAKKITELLRFFNTHAKQISSID